MASLYAHGDMYIPVKAIQMVKKPLQIFHSAQPDDKSVIKVTEPTQQFVGRLCKDPLLNVFHREVSSDRREGGEPIATPSVCS